MRAQRKIIALTILATIAIVALVWKRQPAPSSIESPQRTEIAATTQTPLPPEPTAPPAETVVPAVQPVAIEPRSPTPTLPKTVPVPTQPNAKTPLQDPDARDALAMVGLDPQAEQYWLEAIYDSSLPDKEREDLMEDLNEVGFADPEHVTADDLPLIVNRLRIIEELEPNLDPFMADHLGEAYKDLTKMYAQAAGQ